MPRTCLPPSAMPSNSQVNQPSSMTLADGPVPGLGSTVARRRRVSGCRKSVTNAPSAVVPAIAFTLAKAPVYFEDSV